MNPDLKNERLQATFETEQITHLLYDGKAKTDRRRALEKLIETDPSGIFSNDLNYYLPRTERHTRALAKFVRLVELMKVLGCSKEGDGGKLLESEDMVFLLGAIADDLPSSLHWIMFVPNIKSLFDEEQQAKLIPLIEDWRIIGCYAQTELGHGSNVRGLETTATFVKDEDDGHFIVNSPTLTATKFWPGTLGRTANHAMVIARLIDGDGIDRGVHNFLVQLRSFHDHTLLPGVKTGDIGPKIGYNNMDNGFATFDNVRIPRRNMGMRFSTVDKTGKYKKKVMSDASAKVAYITMMQVRAFIVNEAGKNLAMACTITTRYSAVRRQGFKDNKVGRKEVQILDYTQQQHRILPLIACSYCFFFTGKKVLENLKSIESNLVNGEGDAVTKVEVSDLHASTSCLKSFCSTIAADGMEDLRKACGGHGFLQASGLPELLGTYLQNPTVEGDNHMLPQQTVRVLLKIVQAVQNGNKDTILAYKKCDSIYLVQEISKVMNGQNCGCPVEHEDEFLNVEVLLAAFKHRSARMTMEAATLLQENIGVKGLSFQEAWNACLVQFARVSKAHALYLLLKNFRDGVQGEYCSAIDRNGVSALQDMVLLFGLWFCEKDLGDFLEDGYFRTDHSNWVRKAVLKVLKRVRTNAVALVDCWDFSDFRLKSALGKYDGNVYPAIMASTGKEPLNSTEPGPGYKEHLSRLIVGGVGVSGTISRL